MNYPSRRFRSPDPEGTCRKDAVSGGILQGRHRFRPENTWKWTRESFERIRCPDLPGSFRFRAKPDKSGRRIRSKDSCVHFPSISGAFLPDPARTFRPGVEKRLRNIRRTEKKVS